MAVVNKSTKNTIAFVASSLKLGGLENAVTVMANYFARQGYQISVIIIYDHPVFYFLNPNIKIISPSFRKKGVPKFWYYLKVVFHIRRTILKISPDYIISYGDWSNILILLAVKNLSVPIYISDRASPGLRFPWHIQFLRKQLYPGATGIIAQTQRAAQQKRDMMGIKSNIKVIPNPVRTIQIFEGIERKKIILAVARHYPVKGLDRLIEAFSLLNAREWELHIAGSEGPATPHLKKLVKQLLIVERVKFLGSIKEIDRIYAQSSILVLPSRSEGFPNALIEGMAHGLACVSFDINAGPSEIIRHGINGLLVPDGDIKALAENIQHLIDDENYRLKLGAEAEKIKEELALERIGKMFEDFIFQNDKH